MDKPTPENTQTDQMWAIAQRYPWGDDHDTWYIHYGYLRRTRSEVIEAWDEAMSPAPEFSRWQYDRSRRRGEVRAVKVTVTLGWEQTDG